MPRTKSGNFDHYLNGLKFDYEIGEQDHTLLNKLFIFFNETEDSKSQALANEMLLNELEKKKEDIFNDNPYEFVLKLLINTNALDDPHKNTVPFKIVMTLNDFIRGQDDQKNVLKCMITDFLKEIAFELSYKHLDFFRIVAAVFHLKELCDPIVVRIRKLLEEKDYKKVARIVDCLGCWNEFRPEEIVIPLIFRDALQVVEEFVVRMSKERKYETFKMIDSFFQVEGNCENACIEFAKKHNIPGTKMAKLSAKPLMTTTKKLLALCDIMTDEFPNMHKIVTQNRLCNLLNHRYVQKTANPIHSEHAIKELVGEDAKDLQELVIEFCTQYGHWDDAQKWCRYFNIPESRYLSQSRRNEIKEQTRHIDNYPNEMQLPQFLIDKSVKILSVHDTTAFERMCATFDRIKFVAIDVEGNSRTTTAALMQISTTRIIYIIDIMMLENQRFDADDWIKLKNSLFTNKNILKLGFNWDADMIMLERTFNWNVDLSNGSFLDLQKVWTSLCQNSKFKLPYQYDKNDKKKHQDLKTFVEHCTGKTLDKTLKMMDFSIRPLSEKMLNYAAKDAYSLLMSYFVLQRQARRIGIEIEKMTIS